MLTLLRIKNLAVISELEIEFGGGLNILTGETGAGKSMVLRAVELLCGERATASLVRHGAERLEVEGLFDLSADVISALPEEVRESIESGQCVVRRVVESTGRSRAYIGGRLAGLAELEKLGRRLVSITGQHQQQELLDSAYQRNLLDRFGVSAACLNEAREAWSAFFEAKQALDEFQQASSKREGELRRLEFEAEELGTAKLRVGERAEIEEELLRLSNVESLAASAVSVLEILEGDDQAGMLQHLRKARSVLEGSLRLDKRLQSCVDLLESASIQLDEGRRELAAYGASLEGDPQKLEISRARVAELARLERKYARPVDELVKYYQNISGELALAQSGAFTLSALEQRLNDERVRLSAAENALSAERKNAAQHLPALVERELAQLNMKRAKFSVALAHCVSGPNGVESVQFMLAPNPGEPFRPLALVASGGELARVLLILKVLLHEHAVTGLQIFDEIDSGIGGAVAQIVGERLKALASQSQVLLITHAPQIAALADHHFLISKVTLKDRAETSVKQLSAEERVKEVARMLAGKEVTASFEGSARELIDKR